MRASINALFSGRWLAYAFNLHFGELLAMTVLHLVSFSSFLFENNDLIALHVLQDLPEHFDSG